MSNELVREIWNTVHDRVGDDLRVVTRYEPMNFETRMREDIREAYTDAEDRTIVDDAIIGQLRLSNVEARYNAGTLHAAVRVFDDAWVLTWPDELRKKSGFIVSLQRDGDEATMADLEWCIEYLDREIRPRVD